MSRNSAGTTSRSSSEDSGVVLCIATTTSGSKCKRRALPGLTVCRSHGGGTAASVRVSKKARVSQRAASLWGISSDTGSVSVEDELNRLARNKMADVTALRVEIGQHPEKYHGMLEESVERGRSLVLGAHVKKTSRNMVHPLVAELHKAEMELVQILKLLKEVKGDEGETDVRRIRMQTAREVARLMKAFPGISVDDVAAEVSKRG